MENMAAGYAISPLWYFANEMAEGGGVLDDLSAHALENDPLGGFLDLLGVQGTSPVPLFDFPGSLPHLPTGAPVSSREASAFLAPPTSPSVSSSSVEAADGPPRSGVTVEEGAGDEDEEQEDEKPKQSSGRDSVGEKKKKGQKRQREPRFAFMTKSEVDHLDDGYRWRKYGQKPLKDSPFPRSYYRCTGAECGVKKRVDRSSADPTVVVTTYEGHHTHACPAGHCGSAGSFRQQLHVNRPSAIGHDAGSVVELPQTLDHRDVSGFSLSQQQLGILQRQQQQQQLPFSGQPPPQKPINLTSSSVEGFVDGSYERGQWHTKQTAADRGDLLIRDCGLLHDLVPQSLSKWDE